LKKRVALYAVVAVALAVILPLAVGGCTAVTGQQTDVTLGEPSAVATAADEAIAAVTQSENIQVPATIQQGVLLAASDVAYPPLVYLATVEVTQGEETTKVVEPVGFEVDLCTAVAKKLGLTLQTVSTGWDALVSALQEGSADMIMSAMIITPDLEQKVGFTDPYLSAVLSISAPSSAPVTSAAGLAGKTVGVQVETVSESQVENITGVEDVKTYSTIIDAFADLAAGKLDAVVTDELVSNYMLENNPDLKAAVANTGTIATDTGYAFATKTEDTALLTALNAALAELRADGMYDKICAKWGLTGN
jgi:ABC-type amino acid transport substrate-binding protein